MFSIIITTYNRANKVHLSIDSALKFCKNSDNDEIIIVDDASSDNTRIILEKRYEKHILTKIIRFIWLQENIGVTGAKNIGALNAVQPWLIFLDSDDQLISESQFDVRNVISLSSYDIALLFFRSRSVNGGEIGGKLTDEYEIKLRSYFISGTLGECLPVVRREVFLKNPYHQDLRGFEGISYYHILKSGFKVYVKPIVARLYDENSEDSLTSHLKKGKRSQHLIRGYLHILRTGFRDIGIVSNFMIIFKIVYNIKMLLCFKFHNIVSRN